MSGRQERSVRKIHPKWLSLIGDEACLEMLAIARDLRSGVITPEEYDQKILCGSACCIMGHLRDRVSLGTYRKIEDCWYGPHDALMELFSSGRPSDPQLAADAIERLVFDNAANPWKV